MPISDSRAVVPVPLPPDRGPGAQRPPEKALLSIALAASACLPALGADKGEGAGEQVRIELRFDSASGLTAAESGSDEGAADDAGRLARRIEEGVRGRLERTGLERWTTERTSRDGEARILVILSGSPDPEAVRAARVAALGRDAVRFAAVADDADGRLADERKRLERLLGESDDPVHAALLRSLDRAWGPGVTLSWRRVRSPSREEAFLPLEMSESGGFGGRDVESCAASADRAGNPALEITLQERRGREFRAFTEKLVMRRLAVVVDDEVWIAPLVRDAIGRHAVISFGGDRIPDVLFRALEAAVSGEPSPAALSIVTEERIEGPKTRPPGFADSETRARRVR